MTKSEDTPAHINPTRISLCIIAKNEQDWIAQCIESVKSIVSEIIVVDTGSSDETISIARSLGARVEEFPWNDDFSAPRNFSLKFATCEWILVLDADEAISQQDLAKIQALTRTTPLAAYSLTQRHYSNDPRISGYIPVKGEYPEWEGQYPGYFESSLVRLIPNHMGIEYRGRIHELIEPWLFEHGKPPIVESGIRIHHYGHTKKVKEKKSKGDLYTPLGATKVTEQPTDWKAWFELGVEQNNNGHPAESAEAFERAAALNPSYEATWVNYGYVLCELQRYDESRKALEQALRLNKRSHEAYCNLGVVFLRTSHPREAEVCFRNAITIFPDYLNAWCNLGKSIAVQGRIAESANIYMRALERAPAFAPAKLDLAALFIQSNQKALAARFIEEVLAQPELSAVIEANAVQLRNLL